MPKVKVGDQIKAGDVLCQVEESLWKQDAPLYTPIVIANSSKLKEIQIHEGNVVAGKSCVIDYKL